MTSDGRTPAMGFAHRGARDRAPDNSLEGFALALGLGAEGLESDVWLTADGVPVLDHDGVLGSRRGGPSRRGPGGNISGRVRPIASCWRSDLPPGIPSLEDLYATCGNDFELSLDLLDPAAFGPVLAVADAAGARHRLWLCHERLGQLVAWRPKVGDARLVHSSRLGWGADPARPAARLERAGIDAVNLHVRQWRPQVVEAYHRHNRITLAWDSQTAAALSRVLSLGVAGVYSDHVEAMLAALGASQTAHLGQGERRSGAGA